MMIARRKYNDELTNNTEIIKRRVTTSAAETERAIEELTAIAESYDYNFRLYATVNARSIQEAYFDFADDVMSWGMSLARGDGDITNKMGRLDSEWKSVLHKPRNAADSYFQFDLDEITSDELRDFNNSLPRQEGGDPDDLTESVLEQVFETPNGYHVLTQPFNHTEWEAPVEYDSLDTDGMFHLAQL
jgi:hypothetical protein